MRENIGDLNLARFETSGAHRKGIFFGLLFRLWAWLGELERWPVTHDEARVFNSCLSGAKFSWLRNLT
jgi:hypothetical protein